MIIGNSLLEQLKYKRDLGWQDGVEIKAQATKPNNISLTLGFTY